MQALPRIIFVSIGPELCSEGFPAVQSFPARQTIGFFPASSQGRDEYNWGKRREGYLRKMDGRGGRGAIANKKGYIFDVHHRYMYIYIYATAQLPTILCKTSLRRLIISTSLRNILIGYPTITPQLS